MPYATGEQVLAVLAPDPANPSGTPGELGLPVLEDRVAAASAQVDAAVQSRYSVPFQDPAPRLVVDITVAIAAWLAALTYRKSLDMPATDPVALRYAWATAQLTAIARGEADLPVSDGDADDAGSTTTSRAAVVVNPVGYTGDLFRLQDFQLGYRRGYRSGPGDGWVDGYGY